MSEDAELLTRYAHRGDTHALSVLITRHSPWMGALLRGMLPDSDVDDALQDTWLKVIHSAHHFRGDGIKSYLGRVARSVAIDRLRALGRDHAVMTPLEDEPRADDDTSLVHEPADDAPTPDVQFESSATKQDILASIRALSEGPRQVFLLRIESEMSFREIAETLHIPLGTALTWMRTATRHVKKTLGVTT